MNWSAITDAIREVLWRLRPRRRAPPSDAVATARLVARLRAGQRQKIVAYGTSLTAGGAWVVQLQAVLDRQFPGQALLLNRGLGGMSSRWGVDNLDRRVIRANPDAVFLEFGINDAHMEEHLSVAQARQNLESMIDRIRAANPRCDVMLMVMNPPVGPHLQTRPEYAAYYQTYRDVAAHRGLLLIDHAPAWDALSATDAATYARYIPDGIHPGPLGCERLITPGILHALGIE